MIELIRELVAIRDKFHRVGMLDREDTERFDLLFNGLQRAWEQDPWRKLYEEHMRVCPGAPVILNVRDLLRDL